MADRAQATHESGLAPGLVGWTIHDALERVGGDVLVVASADDERMPVAGARGLATSSPDALASTVAFLRDLRYGRGG